MRGFKMNLTRRWRDANVGERMESLSVTRAAFRVMPAVTLSAFFVGCSPKPENVTAEQPPPQRVEERVPVQQVTPQSHLPQSVGDLPPALVQPVVSGSTISTIVANNSASLLVFDNAVQFLNLEGADVIPPIVGPDLTIAAGGTGAWSLTIPPLPDGYYRVPVTAIAVVPGTSEIVENAFNVYLHVVGGTPTSISYGEYDEATGGAPVALFIE